MLEQAGHSVQLLDPFPGDTDFLTRLESFQPELVGLSLLTTKYQKARELMPELRRRAPQALFCAGGPHPTALPERTIEELGLDFVVLGEAERTIVEVCKRLAAGESLEGLAGVAFRSAGQIACNPPAALVEDLDQIPFPARHLLAFRRYLHPPGPFRGAFTRRATSVMSSRGCPYHCIFCGSHNLFGRLVRQRSVGNLLAEIRHLVDTYQVDAIYFVDDTLTLNRRWVQELCRRLREEGPAVKWGCQVRANTIDPELLTMMKEAGCIWVTVGVESGSAKVLTALKKGITPHILRSAFKAIRQVGLVSSATLVVGSPGETEEDLEETLRLCKELGADFYNFFFLTPFPGSELYEMALENGWCAPEVEYDASWDVRHGDLPVMAVNFSRQELMQIRARLQNAFFWSNYLSYLKLWPFLLRMAFALVRYPRELLRGLGKFARTRRADDIVETVLQAYRLGRTSPKS